MTNKELNQKITKAADIEWYKSVEKTFIERYDLIISDARYGEIYYKTVARQN